MHAPIVLFVFNRPKHTKKTIDALSRNYFELDSDLIIYSDAPRAISDVENVLAVRSIITSVSGFKSVVVVERTSNYGLATNIIDGVTSIVKRFGRVIVLEDDIVTSPYFLKYMNDALDLFEKDERVISIHGYVYPTKEKLPEAFFLRGADCWGWATWERGWSLFNPDGIFLLRELESRKLIKNFDFNGAYSFSRMLKDQIKGKNDSWAVRWYASAFLANKLTLYPGRSLVHNIGNDSTGSHCGSTSIWDVSLSSTHIDLFDLDVVKSDKAYKAFEQNFRIANSFKTRLLNKIKLVFAKSKND